MCVFLTGRQWRFTLSHHLSEPPYPFSPLALFSKKVKKPGFTPVRNGLKKIIISFSHCENIELISLTLSARVDGGFR